MKGNSVKWKRGIGHEDGTLLDWKVHTEWMDGQKWEMRNKMKEKSGKHKRENKIIFSVSHKTKRNE